MALCAGCKQNLPCSGFLKCSLCKQCYDLDCANVSDKRFYRSMTPEQKLNWKCPACLCNMPKKNNINSPARPPLPGTTHEEVCNENVTLRRTLKLTQNDSLIDLDVDAITGHTQINKSPCTSIISHSQTQPVNAITLDQFSQLLDIKLEKMKESLLSQVKETIQKLQNDAADSNSIFQKDTEEKIVKINKSITNIQRELQELESSKKIVLHGLPEYQHESEYDLYDEVNKIFLEILDIDANPFIEQIKRMGRRGTRRPLEIEFTSKRFTRYIIEKSHYFRNTGLTIEIFMTREKLQENIELKKKLKDFRHKGHHAIIRNNRLIVDGKLYIHTDASQTPQNYIPGINADTEDNLVPSQTDSNQASRSQSQFFR